MCGFGVGGGRGTPGVDVSEEEEGVPELGWCEWLLGRSKLWFDAGGGGSVIGMCSGSSFLSSLTLTGGTSMDLDMGVVVLSDFLD